MAQGCDVAGLSLSDAVSPVQQIVQNSGEHSINTESSLRNEYDESNFDLDPNEAQEYHYTLVSNIPEEFHSSDLRNYFATFVEQEQFECFHFRHRPQQINIKTSSKSPAGPSTDPDPTTSSTSHTTGVLTKKSLCGIVKFKEESSLRSFIRKYNGKLWMDRKGNELHGKCMIQKVRLSKEEIGKFAKELIPPGFMPKGNVGTPNAYFLGAIKECRLPPSLIKKLGLEFPKGRRFKKYSKVPMDYGTEVVQHQEDEDEEITTGKGVPLSSTFISQKPFSSIPKNQEQSKESDNDNESNADDDEDRCEDWERHEALHNDVTSQERTKERLYEEEMELVWEKGGPGIVWYTDAQYWEAQEGGFDEQTADDLDVDMQGYYNQGDEDADARDLIQIRKSNRFQQGLEEVSVFKPKSKEAQVPRKRSESPPPTHGRSIGEFEKFTKGVGRRLMEKAGWRDGMGLGSSAQGIPDALDNEGQKPRDKSGLGYYGEKLELGLKSKRPKHSNSNNPFGLDEEERVVIGTVYDRPSSLDLNEDLLRSNAPTHIKRYEFIKKTGKLTEGVRKHPFLEAS